MLLVPSAVKTVLSISQNGISPITLNKQIGIHLNKDIINASTAQLCKKSWRGKGKIGFPLRTFENWLATRQSADVHWKTEIIGNPPIKQVKWTGSQCQQCNTKMINKFVDHRPILNFKGELSIQYRSVLWTSQSISSLFILCLWVSLLILDVCECK